MSVQHDESTCELLCLDLPRAEALRQASAGGARRDEAAARAKALSDATRLQAAVALRDGGELCVCDLAWICECSEKLASHHVRVLRAAGLAESRKDGRMVMYQLTDAGSALLEAVMSTAQVTS